MAWEWTKKRVEAYVKLLQSGKYEFPGRALDALAKKHGLRTIHPGSARRALRKFTGKSPSDLHVAPEAEDDFLDVKGSSDKRLKLIVDMARQGKTSLIDLCEATKLVPSRVQALVQQAIEDGYTITVKDGHLEDAGLQPRGTVTKLKLAPVDGRLKFAVISDLHCGSKYHRGEELADFLERAYDWGARITLNCGDTLDGHRVYKGQEFETQVALPLQIDAAINALPEMPDHKYYFIDGNHDASYWKMTGQPAGEAIVSAAHPRKDLVYLGADVAQLDLSPDGKGKPVRVELLHPDRAGARGQTYHLQNYIESLQGGNKPQILFTGHEHGFVQLEMRNVHAIKVPCFQAQTPYMARKHLQPTIGGLLVEVGLTKRGHVREMTLTHVKYYGSE